MSDDDVAMDGRDLLTALAKDGIACPPTGVPLSEVRTFGPWHWGTFEYEPLDLYMFNVDSVLEQLTSNGRGFALCHAGHGINSFGLNLVTGAGPVAVFVQHHYVGVYADPLYDLASINLTYSRLHVLLTAAAKVDEPLRWLMLESNFRGDRGIVDLDEVRRGTDWQEALRPTESEADMFRSIAERFQNEFLDFSRIDWARLPRP